MIGMIQETSYFGTKTYTYIALRILSRSRHNFVLTYFFVNKYVYCLHNMPEKKRLVTSKVCFGSEKAGLLYHSYNKCALETYDNLSKSLKKNYRMQLQKNDYLFRTTKKPKSQSQKTLIKKNNVSLSDSQY